MTQRSYCMYSALYLALSVIYVFFRHFCVSLELFLAIFSILRKTRHILHKTQQDL